MQTSSASVYTDFHGLADLKTRAGKDAQSALEETARQFEAIFLKMMLKSMRNAVPESGLLDSQRSDFYRGMYDDQLALNLSQSPGLGLADMIVKQMGGHLPKTSVKSVEGDAVQTQMGKPLEDYRAVALSVYQVPSAVTFAVPPTSQSSAMAEPVIRTPEQFVETLWPHAQVAAKSLGVDPRVLLAQSALETGWGQHMIRRLDGNNSFNLFGIKAHRDWEGEIATVSTLEYQDGVAVRRHEPFRAYESYQQSFQDYVQFLQTNPRYQDVLKTAGSADDFVQGLQDAGYATDPRYADKIRSILARDQLSSLRADQDNIGALSSQRAG